MGRVSDDVLAERVAGAGRLERERFGAVCTQVPGVGGSSVGRTLPSTDATGSREGQLDRRRGLDRRAGRRLDERLEPRPGREPADALRCGQLLPRARPRSRRRARRTGSGRSRGRRSVRPGAALRTRGAAACSPGSFRTTTLAGARRWTSTGAPEARWRSVLRTPVVGVTMVVFDPLVPADEPADERGSAHGHGARRASRPKRACRSGRSCPRGSGPEPGDRSRR